MRESPHLHHLDGLSDLGHVPDPIGGENQELTSKCGERNAAMNCVFFRGNRRGKGGGRGNIAYGLRCYNENDTTGRKDSVLSCAVDGQSLDAVFTSKLVKHTLCLPGI